MRKSQRDPMAHPENNQPKITAAKVGFLFTLFFLIAGGLGYPVLNRFDPRQTPGLSDVRIYADMVTGTASPDAGHVRFRVLVPWAAQRVYQIAKPVYRAGGQTASWDPVMFSLLVADSAFVAATAVLIVVLGACRLGNSAAGLVGAFVYLVNFAVPNLRLVGLVDAGEGFFLLALLWCLVESELWPLPLIAALGTLTKESFLPFSVAFCAVWWFRERATGRQLGQPSLNRQSGKIAIWLAISLAASVAAFMGLHRAIEGWFTNPLEFALGLHGGHGGGYLAHIATSIADRQLWYIFLWLLPTAIPNLKRLPRPWLVATGATCIVAFALDAYYGGAPGTIGRALFSIAGPTLSLSSAMLLVKIVD